MNLQARLVVLVFLVACKPATPVPAPAPASASAPDAGVGDAGAETARAARPARVGKTRLAVMNDSTANTVVYVSFGADSAVTKADWKFCAGSASFPLSKKTSQEMPNPTGKYLNATFSFGGPVGCGTTKGEVNINNPSWYDVLDVSLVDGYSNRVKIEVERLAPATPAEDFKSPALVVLGPPNGKTGNEKVFGLFPYGCDICVARQNPPCGISKGKDGCKSGGQYDPSVICQWQGATKGGGESLVKVVLL